MSNIVLWYDDKKQSNCQYNDATYEHRTVIDRLNKNSIKFEVKNTNEYLDPDDLNFYIIELCNVHNEFDIFSLIPNNTKKLFSKGLILILYYPREGHELTEWFLQIYKNIVKNKLDEYNIYFISGDIDFEKNYRNFLETYNFKNFLIPISVDYYAGYYLDNVNDYNSNLNEKRSYDYLFYNGKLRPHRLYSVSELANKKILNNGIVSLAAATHTEGHFSVNQCVKDLKQYGAYSKHLHDFVNNFKPMILDIESNNFSQDNINLTTVSHYEQTYFSVISETSMTVRFVTEKIYKPIYNLHPFIIIGAPKILEYLRSKGYLTFDELFDESYDLEPDHIKRINMVIEEIDKFCKKSNKEKELIFQKLTDKLLHNKRHYIETTLINKSREIRKIFKRY